MPLRNRARAAAGFSYVEVVVATMLIALTLLPAIEALAPGIAGSGIYRSATQQHYQLAAKLEDLLAQPYTGLNDEATAIASPSIASAVYSDASGTPNRRLVYLAGYDGDDSDGDADGFTGADEGLLWIRVEIEGTAMQLESLVSQYD